MIGHIDTHFHLDMYKDYMEKYNYITKNGQYTLCVTNSPGVFLSCKNIFQENKYLKFALGLHPINNKMSVSDLRDFFHLLPNTQYVGEIGLDFSKKSLVDKETQIKFFKQIVEACATKNKLMSIHIRGAEKEALEILEKYHPNRCIIHWFIGTQEMLQKFLNIGCYFSINANMTQKNMEVIENIPKSRILIESDGPYSKVNGKKYSPEMLCDEYEIVSKAFNEPNLKKIIWDNFNHILTECD